MDEKITAADHVSAGLHMRTDAVAELEVHGRYHAECRDAAGNLKWTEDFDNLVTTVGRNDLLDKYFGNTASGALALGLKGTGTAAAGDTMTSHAGWLEVGATNAPAYTAPRKTPAFSAATGGSKTMSAAATFAFTSGGTVAGCFVVSGGTTAIDNTTGILYSAGDFATPRTVVSGDSLAVTYSGTA